MHICSENTMLPLAKEGDMTTVFTKLPAPSITKIEPVGRWFEAYCSRRRHKHTLSYHSLSSTSDESEADLSAEEEDDEELLQKLDPKDWKNQDHYAVLGLGKLRYKATDDQIKRAYKKKVLKHHPDKRKARGETVKGDDDDYFTCITRAIEVLGILTKRRSYDSVDPQFEETVPPISSESKEDFFDIFAPVFEMNARWSNLKNVPFLGKETDTYEQVDQFYSFWYSFDSWREFSYLDEEEKEKGENREERRWIEKQNKAARQRRKKEEVGRIRQLVDNAYACDPRIARFKEEEKARKEAQKQAKRDAAKARADEEERLRQEAMEAERKRKEQEEDEARAQAAVLKKEREAQKKVLKKERKTMRTKLKDYEYFAQDEQDLVTNMQEMEKLVELLALTSLQDLNEDLLSGDAEKAKNSFFAKVQEMNEELEREKQRQLEATQKQSSGAAEGGGSKSEWPEEELALLIKAVNLFPAGTVSRWETIGSFITQHLSSSKRSAKEVLNKAKELQKMNPMAMKAQANEKAFERFAKEHKSAAAAEKSELSERFDSVAEQQIGETGSNPAPWTSEEQKLLEQALRTYPASTPERWERISDSIPARSKKDCMKRYKELVELVRAKKMAQQAVATKSKK